MMIVWQIETQRRARMRWKGEEKKKTTTKCAKNNEFESLQRENQPRHQQQRTEGKKNWKEKTKV